MKRESVIGTAVLLCAFGAMRASAAQPTAPAPAATAVQALEDSACESVADATHEAAFEAVAAATGKTCEDFGFFAADKKKECEASCKRGRHCQKKQQCGDGRCPDPGYCWKCG